MGDDRADSGVTRVLPGVERISALVHELTNER